MATKAPATKAPATKAPATKAPATKAPATKAPATKKCSVCGKPLNPLNTSGIGATCAKHMGKIGRYYTVVTQKPQTPQFTTVVQLCNTAQTLGKSRGYAVRLTGGNAGVQKPVHPIFTVYQYGKRKYVKSGAIAALKAIVAGKPLQGCASAQFALVAMLLFFVGVAIFASLYQTQGCNGGFVSWALGFIL